MVHKIKNMKLYTKLIISFISVIIIPLLLISYIIYSKSTESIKKNALESSNILSEQLTQSINNFIDESNRVTKSILLDNDIIERISNTDQENMSERIRNKIEVDRLLTRILTLKPEINSIILIINDNVFYYNDKDFLLDEAILSKEKWLDQIIHSNNNMTITDVHDRQYYPDMGPNIVFTVGRVLLKSNGTYAGLLLMDLKPTDLLQVSDEILLSMKKYGMKFIVTNKDGGIVYHSDVLTDEKNWSDYIGENYQHEKIKRDDSYLFSSNNLNNDILLVNIEIAKKQLYGNIKEIQFITVIASLLCILFVVVISNVISYRITKPIRKLQDSMKLAEKAQYIPIKSLDTTDEIGSLINSYNSMIIKIEKLVYEVYVAEIKQKEAKILALQTQINPHMLFNTLESIRMKAFVKEEDEIASMIKTLANMFKVVLGKEGKENFFRNEVEYALDYVKLQNNRFDNKFTLNINLEDDIMNSRIMVFILQPIVENSINHGFYGYSKPLEISIDGHITPEEDIIIRISDNGKGMDQDKVDAINKYIYDQKKSESRNENNDVRNSVGLKNIAERIRLYFGEKYYLRVHSTDKVGTVVEFMVPKQ